MPASQAGRRRFDPGRPLFEEPSVTSGVSLCVGSMRGPVRSRGLPLGSVWADEAHRSFCRAERRPRVHRHSVSRSSRGSSLSGGRRRAASPRLQAASRCRCGGSCRKDGNGIGCQAPGDNPAIPAGRNSPRPSRRRAASGKRSRAAPGDGVRGPAVMRRCGSGFGTPKAGAETARGSYRRVDFAGALGRGFDSVPPSPLNQEAVFAAF